MSKIFDAVHRAEMERSHHIMESSTDMRSRFGLVSLGKKREPAAPSSPVKPPADTQNGHPRESLEEATALVTKQLQQCEQQIAEESGIQQQVALRLAQVEQQRRELLERQTRSAEKAAQLEKSKTVWMRQLSALRDATALSAAFKQAQQAQQTNQQSLAQNQQLQQRLLQEMNEYQQKDAELKQKAEALRFKLANALAATGTTDAGVA